MTLRVARGEPRRASQRRARKPEPIAPIARTWRAGDPVNWRGHQGIYRRDSGNGFAEVEFDGRRWRVPIAEIA
jgi:hypothetical protein